MEPGLYLVRMRGGWYGRGVPYCAWLVPYRGDWWHKIGARRIERRNSDLTSVGDLATKGPTRNHVLQPAEEAIEVVHVMTSFLRVYRAADVWLQYCPKPKGWKW
jgi:hypothetical protein